MIRIFSSIVIFLSFSQILFSQSDLQFGNIKLGDLSNKPCEFDPGADAVVISDVGVAKLNYSDGFRVDFERDVKIRIINSDGFDYADVEIPYSNDDQLFKYRASAFNLRNGEKIETRLPAKSFIREKANNYRNLLKFSLPDVHEGTVIEYSYVIRMKGQSLYTLVPWIFQNSIPIMFTSVSVVYPEFFSYKTFISGNPLLVKNHLAEVTQTFAGQAAQTYTSTWYAENVPAFKAEPLVKSERDNQTWLTFELASVDFPGASKQEISPTYESLNQKLLDRQDFGDALKNTYFLKKTAVEITKGLSDDLSKVKAVHKYVSEKLLWDGNEDFTSSGKLSSVYKKGKGNSADINMILIGMLRNLQIQADPVILSTRSNGVINPVSAMYQQFNYLLAHVNISGKEYLIDATDPMRPFDVLPMECLNGRGRLISLANSRFVDLRNSEKIETSVNLDLRLSYDGVAEGDLVKNNLGYGAIGIRKAVKLESEEGYEEIFSNTYSRSEITGFRLLGLNSPDSSVMEKCKLKIENCFMKSGEEFLLDPFLSFNPPYNSFSLPERTFPVDFACPRKNSFSITLQIPDQYEIVEIPENVSYTLGNDCAYDFSFSTEGNKLIIKSNLDIGKTIFPPSEYKSLRDLYSKVARSQDRLIVLRKKLS